MEYLELLDVFERNIGIASGIIFKGSFQCAFFVIVFLSSAVEVGLMSVGNYFFTSFIDDVIGRSGRGTSRALP